MGNGKELVLVTGSSGRIGTRIAEKFGSTYQLVGFDVVPPKTPQPGMDFVPLDLTSEEAVKKALQHVKEKYGDRIASVIHLAAYYNFDGKPNALYDKITVDGTDRLLRLLQPFQVEQFIFSSTMLVHEPAKLGEVISESSPVEPTWPYPESKVKTEAAMHKQHGKIPIVILRIAGVYDDACHSIPISNQLQRVYERQFAAHVFPGNLDKGVAYLHMDDLVDSFTLSIQKRKSLPSAVTLIIGEPGFVSYRKLQDEMTRLLFNQKWFVVRPPKWFAYIGAMVLNSLPFLGPQFVKPWMIAHADDHYPLNISLAKQVLGWEPKRSLLGTLPKMVAFLKSDPAKFYRENGLIIPKSLEHKWNKGK